MKILVASDTHGHSEPLNDLLYKYESEIEMVIHLGDFAEDITMLSYAYSELTFHAVAGAVCVNCEREKIITVANRKILMLHGHLHGVKTGLDKLISYAAEEGVDICLFGHTHQQIMFEQDGILFMNPGTISDPRWPSNTCGYGILDITEDGVIKAEVFPL